VFVLLCVLFVFVLFYVLFVFVLLCVLFVFVLLCVLFVFVFFRYCLCVNVTVLLPPGANPIEVNKYIKYQTKRPLKKSQETY
jgi:hypothetical protein